MVKCQGWEYEGVLSTTVTLCTIFPCSHGCFCFSTFHGSLLTFPLQVLSISPTLYLSCKLDCIFLLARVVPPIKWPLMLSCALCFSLPCSWSASSRLRACSSSRSLWWWVLSQFHLDIPMLQLYFRFQIFVYTQDSFADCSYFNILNSVSVVAPYIWVECLWS
jgi:hypothetical protein